MAEFTGLVPERFEAFNEFDRLGVLLGLPRLRGEENPEYKVRLFDVFTNRSDSTYRGLINGITREIGLSITEVMDIRPVVHPDGTLFGKNPAVEFKETKCFVYSDINDSVSGLAATFDRFEIDENAYTLQQLAAAISSTGYFKATLLEDTDPTDRSMTIFNQSTTTLVPAEDVAIVGSKIRFQNSNLVEGTVSLQSLNLVERVDTELELTKPGRYFIDLERGVLLAQEAPSLGSVIRYKFRNDEFLAKASPVIIHNMQSDDFKTKMFEQIIGEDGIAVNGSATGLGADLINELMSVFPAAFGK